MVKGIDRIVFAALLGFCFAPEAGASLDGDIAAIMSRDTQKNAHFSVEIVDAASGRTIYAKNSHEPMIPASNMKIITSASALYYLGAEYEFTTVAALKGKSLVVIGGGDPLLGDPQTDSKYGRKAGWIFSDIADALGKYDVKSLDEIVIDTTFFDRNTVCANWNENELNRDYACEVCGLNYNLNCVKVSVSKSGSRPTITVDPQTRYFEFENKIKSVSKGSTKMGVYHNSQPNRLVVDGICAPGAGASCDVAVKRPAALFGILLAEHLAQRGIRIPREIEQRYAKGDSGLRVLRVYRTPMKDVLGRCNKDSLNLAAEALVKTISAENTTGRINGEWAHGHTLVGRYLGSLGIDENEYNLDDGSGLSRENRLTANLITTVLLSLYNSDRWGLYKETLAVGGVDGTIAKYFKDPSYSGEILGKTGYIEGVRAFSGVCSAGGQDYIFSILTRGGNSFTRGAINDIVAAIIDNQQ
jgi:D-alanyl-D-alanine carboxypeptidase/D-alanyl-D-alanine-endopeptidase (penicillin-binding protein 4)